MKEKIFFISLLNMTNPCLDLWWEFVWTDEERNQKKFTYSSRIPGLQIVSASRHKKCNNKCKHILFICFEMCLDEQQFKPELKINAYCRKFKLYSQTTFTTFTMKPLKLKYQCFFLHFHLTKGPYRKLIMFAVRIGFNCICWYRKEQQYIWNNWRKEEIKISCLRLIPRSE